MLDHYPESAFRTPAHRFVTFGTDFCFRCGTRSAVRAFTAAGVATYLYSFSFQSSSYKDPSSLLCELEDEVACGVYHGADVSYVFSQEGNDTDKEMSSAFGLYWTNFAKYGTPNGPGVPSLWQAYSVDHDNHLELTLPVVNGSNLFKPNCDFWDTLPRHGAYPSSLSAASEKVLV